MKSLAIVAMAGVLAMPIAYIAPALADDADSDAVMQLSDNAMQNQNNDNNSMQAAPGMDNVGSMNDTNNLTQTNNNNDANINNSNSNSVTTGTDEGSPDTATGDDDY